MIKKQKYISKAQKYKADPKAFAVIKGKLYLSYDKNTIKRFKADAGTGVKQGNTNWNLLDKEYATAVRK